MSPKINYILVIYHTVIAVSETRKNYRSLEKYILDNFDNQKQGKKIFEFLLFPFEGRADMPNKFSLMAKPAIVS